MHIFWCVCVCVYVCVGVCLLGATSVYTARGSLIATHSLQRHWPRPPALYNNRKGNGLPKASSFRLTVLPALAQSCHETISSIYHPYIHHQWWARGGHSDRCGQLEGMSVKA